MTFTLHPDEKGKLTLTRPNEDDVQDIRIRRAFPWSNPNQFISLRNPEGKELLLIDDLTTLPASLRTLIEQHLATTSFIPRITHINQVDVRFGYQQWNVDTDRGGGVEFRVQEREDIRFLPDGRFTLKDADGNLYELPKLDHLDDHSRHAIESLV